MCCAVGDLLRLGKLAALLYPCDVPRPSVLCLGSFQKIPGPLYYWHVYELAVERDSAFSKSFALFERRDHALGLLDLLSRW